MKIEKATRKSHFYNEDRYIVGDNYCMVLDGATSLVSSGIKPTEGSWFVSRIKQSLPQKCDNVIEKLEYISKKTYAEFIELSKIDSKTDSVLYYPSAGLSCAVVKDNKVQIFTTGDCEAVVKLKDGKIIRHIFPMLAELDKVALDMMIEYKKAHGVSMLNARKALNGVLIENRKLMNKKGGYPVFTVSEKILQLISSAKFIHGTPAGLPWGIPGMGLFMEGAIQQAPQFFRQANFPILLAQFCKGVESFR